MPQFSAAPTYRCELAEGENLRLRTEHALLGVDELDRVPSYEEPSYLCLTRHAALPHFDLSEHVQKKTR